MKNLDLNLLRSFRAVAERGSISTAASSLHFSQPAISLQLKRLEEQIGKKLFERESHGLRLTQFGKELLTYARKLSEMSSEIGRLARAEDSRPSGMLRIGTYTTISSYLISQTVAAFLEQYPEVRLQYVYDTVEVLLERIKSQELEGAILSDVPPKNTLHAHPLFSDELVYAVSTKAKFKIGDSMAPSDLAHFPFLSYPLRFDFCYRTVEMTFGKYLAQARVPIESTSFDTLKQMLLLGVGGTFIPRYLIENEIQKGEVRVVKVGRQRLPLQFLFVSLSDESLSTTARKFREAIVSSFV